MNLPLKQLNRFIVRIHQAFNQNRYLRWIKNMALGFTIGFGLFFLLNILLYNARTTAPGFTPGWR